MKIRFWLATVVTVVVGLIVLAGFFIQLPAVQEIRTLLIGWGVTLAGVAGLVGIIHLVGVHWNKAKEKNQSSFFSLLVILSFLVTFAAGMWLTPSDTGFQHVITSVQVPVETSLMAVLAVSLAYASLRLLQRRKGVTGIVFIASAIIFLLIFSGFLPVRAQGITRFISQLPSAGGRGILLGVALGSLITGLKILLGTDRPYNG
jgi:hypothetical protein